KVNYVTLDKDPVLEYGYMSQRQKTTMILQPSEFIEIKGWKALGNKLIDKKLISIREQSKNDGDPEIEPDTSGPHPSGSGSAVQANLFGSVTHSVDTSGKDAKKKKMPSKKKSGQKNPPSKKGYLK